MTGLLDGGAGVVVVGGGVLGVVVVVLGGVAVVVCGADARLRRALQLRLGDDRPVHEHHLAREDEEWRRRFGE